MLLGVRGELDFMDTEVRSWEIFPRTRHSEKPEGVRKLIERVSPGPRLEMFARRLAHGWVSWGNQIERRLFDDLAIPGLKMKSTSTSPLRKKTARPVKAVGTV